VSPANDTLHIYAHWRAKNPKKSKIEKAKEEKTQKVKSESSLETFATGKTDGGSKDCRNLFNPPCTTKSSVDPVTEMLGSSATLDVPSYIFPLMRPPYMKRLSPSLPDGPTFFKKVRCGLNLEQR
jgi:hypothetical protein